MYFGRRKKNGNQKSLTYLFKNPAMKLNRVITIYYLTELLSEVKYTSSYFGFPL